MARSESGVYRRTAHQGPARGMVMFFSGGFGTDWWSADRPDVLAWFSDLRVRGLDVVEVRWGNWLRSAPGELAGPARLACRPATVMRWAHEQLYPPLGATPQGVCGFCVTGNSGGASQVAYALSHYGLDTILDGVFPSGGPAHTALDKACLGRPGDEAYSYAGTPAAAIIDSSYGFDRAGPCSRADASFEALFDRDSIDVGGSDYSHPRTRVHMIVGSGDGIRPHADDYANRLRSEGTAVVLQIADTPHDLASSPTGRSALLAALSG